MVTFVSYDDPSADVHYAPGTMGKLEDSVERELGQDMPIVAYQAETPKKSRARSPLWQQLSSSALTTPSTSTVGAHGAAQSPIISSCSSSDADRPDMPNANRAVGPPVAVKPKSPKANSNSRPPRDYTTSIVTRI